MQSVTEEVIEGIARQCQGLLIDHQGSLDHAYMAFGDEKFTVTLKIDFTAGQMAPVTQVNISYNPEPPVKDKSYKLQHDGPQLQLFEGKEDRPAIKSDRPNQFDVRTRWACLRMVMERGDERTREHMHFMRYGRYESYRHLPFRRRAAIRQVPVNV